jgi:hypothetical protein
VGGNLSGAQGGMGFSSLHLAKAGDLGITRGDTGGYHGGATASRSPGLGGLGRLCRRQASVALMGCNAAAYFLLPGKCGIGLAQRCAQGFRFPSDAPSKQNSWLEAQFLSLKPGENRDSQTLLSKEKGGQTEKNRHGPDRWTRTRWKQPDFCLLPELRGVRPVPRQPILLC